MNKLLTEYCIISLSFRFMGHSMEQLQEDGSVLELYSGGFLTGITDLIP